MATIKTPNAAQDADKVYLQERLTPFPPADVAAEMVVIHTERGTGPHCGCAACVDQFGDDMETEDFPDAVKV
jgi:hypothetical protein